MRIEVGYIPAIEGLRGVAVLWVVLFHYAVVRGGQFADPYVSWIDGSLPLKVFVRNGFLGVDLFFLITGFLLTLPWFKHAREGRPHPSAREFYVRRARRILPAYYVQLAVLFLVFLPLLHPGLWRIEPGLVLTNLGLHSVFLHYTTPYTSASLGINGALWTLGLEMQYYLILPLLGPWFSRTPYIAAATLLAASVVWKAMALHDLEPLIAIYNAIGARWNPSEAAVRHLAGTQLPAYLGHFALGILCGRVWLACRAKPGGRTRTILSAVLAAGSVLILYAALAGYAAPMGEYAWIVIPAAMATTMWAAVSLSPTWGTKLLGVRPLAFTGRVSYSMYLYHLPLVMLFNQIVPPTLGALALPCYLGLLYLVSAASYRFVERPFMRASLTQARAAAVTS